LSLLNNLLRKYRSNQSIVNYDHLQNYPRSHYIAISTIVIALNRSTSNILCKRKKLLTRLLYLSILVSVSSPLLAIDFYDAEVLVFQYNRNEENTEELNTPTISHVRFNLELNSLRLKKSLVEIEPVIDGYLSEQAKMLASTKDYRIIFYGGWSQKTSDPKKAPYVEVILPDINNRGDTLRGILRLFATDLLYIDVLMRYNARPSTVLSSQSDTSSLPFYFIDERRRVKFNEVHFFDHPRFGILVSVHAIQ